MGRGRQHHVVQELNTQTNKGRYGVAVFLNGKTYLAGCSIEVGQRSCSVPWKNGRLAAGDTVVIIVGEQGHLEEHGDFSFDWNFTFHPDS